MTQSRMGNVSIYLFIICYYPILAPESCCTLDPLTSEIFGTDGTVYYEKLGFFPVFTVTKTPLQQLLGHNSFQTNTPNIYFYTRYAINWAAVQKEWALHFVTNPKLFDELLSVCPVCISIIFFLLFKVERSPVRTQILWDGYLPNTLGQILFKIWPNFGGAITRKFQLYQAPS